jgi:hypothetical protein
MAKKQQTLEGLEDDGGYVYLFIFNINVLKLFRKNIKKLINFFFFKSQLRSNVLIGWLETEITAKPILK